MINWVDVDVVERPAEGMRVVLYTDSLRNISDTALWAVVKLRKETTCVVSGRVLHKGEQAFAPVGNQLYRMKRIAPEVLA